MKFDSNGETFRVFSLEHLTAGNCRLFVDSVRAGLHPEHRCIEVDLTETGLLDSEGIGALISLYKTMATRDGRVVLRRAQPAVGQIIRLLRLDQLFELA
jgi:anti-anti-sigma factor